MSRKSRPSSPATTATTAPAAAATRRAPTPRVGTSGGGRSGRFWLGLVLYQIVFASSVFVLTRAHYDRASAAPQGPAAASNMPGAAAAGFSSRSAAALTASPSQPAAPVASPAAADLPTPALIARANQQFTEQDFGGAAVTYTAVVEREPANVEMLNNLGISLHNAGRSEEGVARLEQALQINPDHQRALLTLGFIHRALGATDRAREVLSRAVAVDASSRIGQEAQRLLGEP